MQRSEKRDKRTIPQWVRNARGYEPGLALLAVSVLLGIVLYGLALEYAEHTLQGLVPVVAFLGGFFGPHIGVRIWFDKARQWLRQEWQYVAGEAFVPERVEAVLTRLARSVHSCPPETPKEEVKTRKDDFRHAHALACLLGKIPSHDEIRDYTAAAATEVAHA